jgi:hypothetical protein
LYVVTLSFAEIYHKQAGRRLFDIRIEDSLVDELDNYDIHAHVGHDYAVDWAFPDILVDDGQLKIDFISVKDSAKVSAIAIQHSQTP